MADITFADKVYETSTTIGPDAFVLAGRKSDKFRTVAEGHAIGDRLFYRAELGNQYEAGIGTYRAGNTLERTTILESSNDDQIVSFGEGVKDVFETVPASFFAGLVRRDVPTTTTLVSPNTARLYMEDSDGNKRILPADFFKAYGTDLGTLPEAMSVADTDYLQLFRPGSGDMRVRASVLKAYQDGATAPSPTVTGVTVAPSAASMSGGGSQNFTATVEGSNAPSQAVTWTATAGTITAAGVFTAPAATSSIQTITVRATSVADNTKSGTSTVTIAAAAAPISTVTGVSVTPSTANVSGGTTQQFVASVAGQNSPSQSVTWTASAGSINSVGLFTAPAATSSVQTITITATSTQDATKSGTATATVAAANAPVQTVDSVTVSPSASTLAGSGTQQFTATVSGSNAPSQSVSWTCSAGTISTSGMFTAPAATSSTQTITVTATSTQDNTKSGTATVTVNALAAPTYTITGFSGNAVKETYDASTNTGTVYSGYRSTTTGPFTNGNGYFNISPTPTSAISGWGESPTEPPPEIAASDNTTGSIHANGLIAMTKPNAWANASRLWFQVGTTNTKKYFWIKPAGGVAQCLNPNGMTITGA